MSYDFMLWATVIFYDLGEVILKDTTSNDFMETFQVTLLKSVAKGKNSKTQMTGLNVMCFILSKLFHW